MYEEIKNDLVNLQYFVIINSSIKNYISFGTYFSDKQQCQSKI